MSVITVFGVWKLTFALFALASKRLVSGMRTSLTDEENQMMENGTFVYNSLSTRQKKTLFNDYEITYSRKYATAKDRDARFKLFEETLKSVDELNAATKAGNSTAVFGINAISDLSPREFKMKYLGSIEPFESDRLLSNVVEVDAFRGESTSVDWAGILTTPIKNQGDCGSCWAFAATEQIESDAIRAGLTTPKELLSPQQLLQCTYTPPNCDGGFYTTAFDYVAGAGGITYESAYPYNTTTRRCDITKNDYAVTVTAWNRIEGQQNMINYVLGGGILTVAIEASKMGSYQSGIFPVSICTQDFPDHAVQIVGVNVEGGYWIIRNSWGDRWGDKGYFKIALASGANSCHIIDYAVYVEVATVAGSNRPSFLPTYLPSNLSPPSQAPTRQTRRPSPAPTIMRTLSPTSSPTSLRPTASRTSSPTSLRPTASPTSSPTSLKPTASRTSSPTSLKPTASPTSSPTSLRPTASRTSSPTSLKPTASPTSSPTSLKPTASPTSSPTSLKPTASPTSSPRSIPTVAPTSSPSPSPTATPTSCPSSSPISLKPTAGPTSVPTVAPTPTIKPPSQRIPFRNTKRPSRAS